MIVKIKTELKKLLPPTLFFFFTLHLIALLRTMMIQDTGITLGSSLSMTVAALILGKAVLLADMLPFINRHPDKPLIYNVAWKTCVYFSMSVVIHYAERLLNFWKNSTGLVAGNEKLYAEMIWSHFWAAEILIFILILSYCIIREFSRVIGEEKVFHMFFGGKPESRN